MTTTIKEQEAPVLLPCPFDGGAAKLRLVGGLPPLVVIHCPTCGFCSPRFVWEDEARRAWNRRADPWIPVAERLPAEGVHVLLLVREGQMWIASHKVDYWFDDDLGSVIGETAYGTHWMPLPAAPISFNSPEPQP